MRKAEPMFRCLMAARKTLTINCREWAGLRQPLLAMGRASAISAVPLVAAVLVMLLTFVACYLVSTLVLDPPLVFFLPTLSELGDRPPASSIFSFGVSFSAFCFGWVLFARFKDVHQVLVIERYRTLNKVACGLGMFMCLALLAVCTFQSQNVPVVHYGAALTLFVCATVYVWLMSVISAKLSIFRPQLSAGLVRLRFVLAAAQTIAFVGVIVFAIVWQVYESGTNVLFWWHFVALSEYVTVMAMGLYLLSLVPEFRFLNVQVRAFVFYVFCFSRHSSLLVYR